MAQKIGYNQVVFIIDGWEIVDIVTVHDTGYYAKVGHKAGNKYHGSRLTLEIRDRLFQIFQEF